MQRYDRSDTCGEFRLNRLTLRGEVHFLQEGLEAGVGAEGVEDEIELEPRQQTVAFLNSSFQPGNGLIMVA